MAANNAMIVARRRNTQRRGAAEFLANLATALGVASRRAQIAKAEASVQTEERLDDFHLKCLNSGDLLRVPELEWDAVCRLLRSYRGPLRDSNKVLVFMCHFRDFAFWIPFADVITRLRALVLFDGDSIYITDKTATAGIGIDYYESEVSKQMRFTIDIWPHPRKDKVGRRSQMGRGERRSGLNAT